VQQALTSSIGVSTRLSTTTGINMMYVAVLIKDQSSKLGFARVALPLTEVENSVNGSIALISWGIVITALLLILATFFITLMLTRPIRQATQAAMMIAGGDLDQKINLSSHDELGSLVKAFNLMTGNLKETMTTLSSEKNKMDTVLSTITDGVMMTDSRSRIILANPAAENS
jgi:signal transduction histidine kinase